MANPVLDLTKPGKLWAAVENEDSSTFHIVLPQAAYTKDALSQNANINPADELMTPFSVAHTDAVKAGAAILDLASTGRAAEMIGKLDQRFEQGQAAPKTVKAVVIATARQGNKVPSKQLAEVQEFELAPTPKLKLDGVTTVVSVPQYKGGMKDFVCQMRCEAIGDVQLSTSTGAQIRVDGGPTGASITLKANDAQLYTIRIAVPFSQHPESRSTSIPWHMISGTPWNGTFIWAWYEGGTRTDTREVWTGGDLSLKAQGTGLSIGIVKSVKLRAESWASEWLQGALPRSYAHGHC